MDVRRVVVVVGKWVMMFVGRMVVDNEVRIEGEIRLTAVLAAHIILKMYQCKQ